MKKLLVAALTVTLFTAPATAYASSDTKTTTEAESAALQGFSGQTVRVTEQSPGYSHTLIVNPDGSFQGVMDTGDARYRFRCTADRCWVRDTDTWRTVPEGTLSLSYTSTFPFTENTPTVLETTDSGFLLSGPDTNPFYSETARVRVSQSKTTKVKTTYRFTPVSCNDLQMLESAGADLMVDEPCVDTGPFVARFTQKTAKPVQVKTPERVSGGGVIPPSIFTIMGE